MARPAGSRGQPRSPNLVRAPDGTVTIFARGRAVLAQERGAVEVDDVAMLPDDEGRSHCEAGADHIADHDAKAVAARFLGNQQRLGETAALVELDVDHVEAANETGHVVETERAFIGSDRNRRTVAFEVGFPAAGERLLEQGHTVGGERFDERVELIARIALVGIDSEPYAGPRGANGADPFDVELELAGELDLDRFGGGVAPRAFGHRLRVIRAEREGRDQRLSFADP